MFLGLISQVYAQCDPGAAGDTGIDLGGCLLLKNGDQIRDVYSTPTDLVNLIIKNIFLVSGIVLFVLVIVAGFKFFKGGSKGVEEAKTLATSAIVGFIIMFSAYWIVQIIKFVTGADLVI
jgi:hypothetical protein